MCYELYKNKLHYYNNIRKIIIINTFLNRPNIVKIYDDYIASLSIERMSSF